MPELQHLSQKVSLWLGEARVLQRAIDAHLERLNHRSAGGHLTLTEALSLKPLGRVHQQLTRMLCAPWPQGRTRIGYMPKQRIWRLSFDELLLLNRLYSAGTLASYIEGPPRVDLFNIGGEINQKAQNLTYYFQL